MWVHITQSEDANQEEVINMDHVARVRFLEDIAIVRFADGSEEKYKDPTSVSSLGLALKNR